VTRQISLEPEYALLLDAVAPLAAPRVDHTAWEPARWGKLLDVADWHRLSPVIYTHLRAVGGAPAAVLSALERAYLANAARSLYLREATDRVVGQLNDAGVPSVLLKGAALVATAYDDPAEREMLDIDTLVRTEHLEVATAAVSALGYETRPDPDPVAAAEAARRPAGGVGSHHGAALVDPESLVAVELHHHITTGDEGRFSLDGLWERARPASRSGHLVPAPEDLLIHVCFHFTRNRLGGSAHRRNTGGALAQILDMRRVIGGNALDWQLLTTTAHDCRLGTRVFLGLFAAGELGVPIPRQEIEAIRPEGFDDQLGRRLVQLRVLRAGDHMPVRSMRWMFAPSREALRRGWNADPTATLSLARAYMRRAKAHLPEARAAAGRPWIYVQDRRLNGHIEALRERV
jgi:hypothetical protein